jgi:hypothetical protein
MPTAKKKTVTGVDGALVFLKPRVPNQPAGEVFLRRGDELPDNLVDGEVERLDKLGVFADPDGPRLATDAAAASRVAALEAELAALRERAENAERTVEEVQVELDRARKAAPKGAEKATAPNPANPVTTAPPTPR